jgi:hypothetical protein
VPSVNISSFSGVSILRVFRYLRRWRSDCGNQDRGWADTEIFDNRHVKALDFSDYSTNNAVIDIVLMYSLIRSEQAEEGARSFLLLWLV